MILAVMSLRQWIEANNLWDEETQTFNENLLREALIVLEITQVKILLLASNQEEMQQFLTVSGTVPGETVYVKPVANDTEQSYVDAVRQAYRQLTPRAVVSFIPNLQRIEEFSNFSFCNSGQSYQHYHAWVDSYAPVHPSKNIIVMPVGEIVKQNRAALASVLLPILEKRCPDMEKNDALRLVFKIITEHEQGPEGYIYKFKMGFMEESVFDQCMIDAFSASGIPIIVEEFNRIWQATNPDFSSIKPWLDKIDARELRRAGYRFEAVGYTNPKDMHHLLDELRHHDQAYVLENGQLMGFAGLPLSCSYIKQNTVLEMIADLLNERSYSQTFQLAESPKKIPSQPIYYVTSATEMNENLAAIAGMQGVNVLLGWDGSPVHEWVTNQAEYLHETGMSKYASTDNAMTY